MTGRPQTILELLRAITGWSKEEVVEAFGKIERLEKARSVKE